MLPATVVTVREDKTILRITLTPESEISAILPDGSMATPSGPEMTQAIRSRQRNLMQDGNVQQQS